MHYIRYGLLKCIYKLDILIQNMIIDKRDMCNCNNIFNKTNLLLLICLEIFIYNYHHCV